MVDQGVKRMTGRVCLFILSAGVLAVIGAAGFAVGSDRAPERGDGRSLGPGEEDSQACCCSLSEFPCDDASPGTLPLFAGRDEAGVSEITGKGMYLGQKTPGLVPEVFAPGIISVEDRYVIGIAFSPDGQECYFAERTANWSASWIMMTVCRDGVWTTPQKAPFSNERSLCPSVSADGKHLFFSSNRGTAGK